RRIDAAIETAVGSCENRGLLGFRVDGVNHSVHCVGNDEIRSCSRRWITALADTERGECDRIEFACNRQVSIALKLLQGGSRLRARFAIRLTEMITGGFKCFLCLHGYLDQRWSSAALSRYRRFCSFRFRGFL